MPVDHIKAFTYPGTEYGYRGSIGGKPVFSDDVHNSMKAIKRNEVLLGPELRKVMVEQKEMDTNKLEKREKMAVKDGAEEVADTNTPVSVECQEDIVPVNSDAMPDKDLLIENHDATMDSCKSCSKSFEDAKHWESGKKISVADISSEESFLGSETESPQTSMEVDAEQTEKEKELHIGACREIFRRKSNPLSDQQKSYAKKCSDWLLHDIGCPGCEDFSCKLVKKLKEHKNMCRDVHCSACITLECAEFIHSIYCSLSGCSVSNCKENREEIKDEIKYYKEKNEYEVLFSETSEFQIGQIIRFQQDIILLAEEDVNKGTYGSVTRAHIFCPKGGVEADMAVKRSHPMVDLKGQKTYKYPVKKEASIFNALSAHPNIAAPTLILRNIASGEAVLIMERYRCSLWDIQEFVGTKYNCRFNFGQAIFYWGQAAEAVKHLHDHDIIHKDIKSLNILVTDDLQRACLADFDASTSLEDEHTSGNLAPKGTKGYMAPEVLNKEPHGKPADIFSLGCLLVDLIVGIVSNDTEASRMEKVNRIREKDEALGAMIASCLSPNPQERPSIQQLLENKVLKDYTSCRMCLELTPPKAKELHRLKTTSGFMVPSEQLIQKLKELESANEESVREAMNRLPRNLPSRHLPVPPDHGAMDIF